MASPSPTRDTGVEVIDPELYPPARITAHDVMNASEGEQQGIHAHVVQQQALKVSGNRHSLSKAAAWVVSRVEDNKIARMIDEDTISKQNLECPFPRYGKLQRSIY
ncbi:hypothetical protein E2562_038481 [Oryza meyeriana var. granulata]|uniref:Uncharacterized protein n=1 Tax=Oryza meyeriana var. granulata TaxID=110450 RepID=A0A6G1C3G6_9ORYZ|nr:hypothetical protein E2562_038481 [Oryza meyeriana var. granulata]